VFPFSKENTMFNVQSMSDADLLSVVVGPKNARQLLKDAGGSLAQLVLSDALATCGPARKPQWKLEAARELVRRSLAETLRERDCLSSPGSVRDLLRVTLQGRDHEVFLVVFLDAQNRLIAVEEMFRGTLTQTSVYPREVVKRSLAHACAAVVFAHNHPSGVAEPSRADELLTSALKQALALVDVKVLDHFVVGGGAALSFAESGLI
jgi:DNA repair protein RadC